jgi:hypothetical protein
MTTAIASNVFIAFWDASDSLNSLAQSALTAAWNRGLLVVAAPVYAELLAFAGRSEPFLEAFLEETGITVEWEIDDATWRAADASKAPAPAVSSPTSCSALTPCATATASSRWTPASTPQPSPVLR